MNTTKDPKKLALELCERSICKVKMAAVLVDRKGRVFSWGWNNPGEDAMGEHAEEMALARANPKRLENATVVVAGFRKRHYVKSKPCEEKCLPLLRRSGVANVVYHTKEGEWVAAQM